MNWMVLAGSLAAVFAVAMLVWLMGMGKTPAIDGAEHAMRLAAEAHSGFQPIDAVIDVEGLAALVQGENGEIVVIRPHGAQIAARAFKEPPATRYSNGQLLIETADRMFGNLTIRLDADEADRWTVLLGSDAPRA